MRKNPPEDQGDKVRREGSTQRGVQNIEMLIKDASAFIEDAQRVITEVAQVCQQRHGAAQVFLCSMSR